MPVIGKQRRANRSKAFRTRRDRFGGSSKPKPFCLTGKLKSNNNLLAKALSEQKQESQLLFTQKIELTKQLQVLTAACNKRDMAISNIQKNAKEMLTMLVTLTNYVTNTIVSCQEFTYKPDGNTPRPSSASTTRRESTRRLSTKSPARGVVKPMVSGHTITKPTINLRRVNMQRINNILELSDIVESSPDRRSNTTINTSHTHTAAITGTSRLGYEGERRRRLPERIPVEYAEADDDEGETPGRQETRRSSSFSRRLSNSLSRKYSENSLSSEIRSPSVSLCDVSKLLQNSQTINVRMLRDSQGNGDFGRLSNTVRGPPLRNGNGDTTSVNLTLQQFEEARKSLDKTAQPSPASPRRVQIKKSGKSVEKTDRNLEIDPMEGPSWLLNGSATDENTDEERTVEIFQRKHILRKLETSESESEGEAGNKSDDSMEFTECVKPVCRPTALPIVKLIGKQTNIDSNLPSQITQAEINGNDSPVAKDSDNSLNLSETPGEQCANINALTNHPSAFVTDRRRQYIENDDDDDDTIMLKFIRNSNTAKFDINDLRLPVVSCPIIQPAESGDSEPEVTTTIQAIPQNFVPPNLVDNNIQDRLSNFSTIQLPRIDDESIKTKKAKRSNKRKQPRKNIQYNESCLSSDSDCEWKPKKKPTNRANPKNLKDPSSAKVVLQKLNDTQMKVRSLTPDRNHGDKTQDFDATSERTFETGHSGLLTDSNSSTHSVSEKSRPRRQKAPVNMKEPSLHKKLRR